MTDIELIKCFENTVACSAGVDLANKTLHAIDSTKVYFENFSSVRIPENKRAKIGVESITTFAAAEKYREFGRVAVLNFANSETPGGGVTVGAMSQEECLCRCSNLYPCLTCAAVFEDYYAYHRAKPNCLSSDRIIYTRDITVFKSESLDLLKKTEWFDVDIITCAAPYCGNCETIDTEMLLKLFKSRIKNIIEVAIENSVDVLILGAFGCGAFKNPPDIVAQAFYEIIDKYDYTMYFDMIVFAIKSTDDDLSASVCPNFNAFSKWFPLL